MKQKTCIPKNSVQHQRRLKNGELEKVKRWDLEDLEKLLELDHQLPIGLHEVFTEVVLARVDTGARDLKQYRTCNQYRSRSAKHSYKYVARTLAKNNINNPVVHFCCPY